MERRSGWARMFSRPRARTRVLLLAAVFGLVAGLPPVAAVAPAPVSAATAVPMAAWTSPADPALAFTASDAGAVALVVRSGEEVLVGLDAAGADRWTTPVTSAEGVHTAQLRTGPDGTIYLTAVFEGTVTLGRPGASITLQGLGSYVDNWGTTQPQATPVAAALTPTGELRWAVAGTSSNPWVGGSPSGDRFGPALGDGGGGAWFQVATNGTLAIGGATFNGGQAGIYVAHVNGAGSVDAVAQFAKGLFPTPGEVHLVGGDVVLTASFLTGLGPEGTPNPTVGLHDDAVTLPLSGPYHRAHAVARLHPDSGVAWATPLTASSTDLAVQRMQAHADGTVTLAVGGRVLPPGPLSSLTVGTGAAAMTDNPKTATAGFLVRLGTTGAATWIRHDTSGYAIGADIRPDGSTVWSLDWGSTISGRAADGTEQWRYDLANDGLSRSVSSLIDPVAAGGPAPVFVHGTGVSALMFGAPRRDLRTTIDVPATLELGATSTATVTVTNAGAAAADGVTAPLTIADPGTFTVSLADVTTGAGTWVDGAWTIGHLEPGASAVAHLTLTPVPGAPIGASAALVVTASADPTTAERNPADDTGRATVTLTAPQTADVAVTTEVGPTSLPAPSSTPIRFRATNNGPVAATVILQPSLTAAPAQATTVAWGPATAGTLGAGSQWTVTLAAGQSATLDGSILVGSAAQPGTVTYGLCRTSSSAPDPTSANDCATVTAPVTPANATRLQITAQPSTVAPGQPATYQVTVTNAGPATATGGTVTLSAPRALTSASGSGTFVPTATGATWSLPPIPSGSAASRTVASDPTTWAPLTAMTVTGSLVVPGDTTTTDNTATATATLPTPVDVAVTNATTATSVKAGSSEWVVFQVANQGPSRTTMTLTPTVTAVPPVTVTPWWSNNGFALSPATGPWSVTLSPGGYAMVGAWIAVPAGAGTGTVQVELCRTASSPDDPDLSNDCASTTLTIRQPADLAVSVVREAPTVTSGQTARWTVTVTNQGPATATDPRVTVQATGAGAGQPIDSTTGDGTAAPAGGSAWEWAPGPLPAGAGATRTFTADTTTWVPGLTVTLTATATTTGATTFDPTGTAGNSTAGATVTRDAPAELPDLAQQLPNVEVTDLTHDAAGRLVVVGTFARPVTVGTGPTARSLVPAGWLPGRTGDRSSVDALVAVFDVDGRLAWVSTVAGRDAQEAVAVGTDAAGNVYVTGALRHIGGADPVTVRFGSGPWADARPLPAALPMGTFVAAWSPSGNLLWDRVLSAAPIAGANQTPLVRPGDLAVAADGRVTVAAGYRGDLRVETGSGPWRLGRTTAAGTFPPNPNAGNDLAVVSFDRDGTVLWQHRLRGIAFVGATIRLAGRPDGGTLVAAAKGSSPLLDVDTATPTLINVEDLGGGWLFAYDRDGARQWATVTKGIPRDVTVSPSGDLWLLECTYHPGGGYNLMLRRLAADHVSSDVELLLGVQPSGDQGRLDHDADGNVAVTGPLNADLVLGKPVGWELHPTTTPDETFTASFDRTGAVRWATRNGRIANPSPSLITVLPNGSVVTALARQAAASGAPTSPPTFGNQPGAATLPGIDGTASVLLRHGPAPTPTTGRITGTTTDATTGLPIAGITVDLVDAYPSGRVAATTTSAPDGTFSFDAVPVGGYRLRAADGDPTYETTWIDHTTAYRTAPDTTTGTTVTIAVRPRSTGTITGTLTRTDTSGPLSPARVLLYDDQGYLRATTTDPDGTYTFTGLHPGDYRIRAVDTGPCGCAPTWIGGNPLGATAPLTLTDGAALTADAALHPLRADLGVIALAAPTIDTTGHPTAATSIVVGVASHGPDTSRPLVVHLTLPPGSGGTTRAVTDRGTVTGDTWFLPPLAPGQTARLTLITDPLAAGTHTITASMSHPAMDTNPTNDTATTTITIP